VGQGECCIYSKGGSWDELCLCRDAHLLRERSGNTTGVERSERVCYLHLAWQLDTSWSSKQIAGVACGAGPPGGEPDLARTPPHTAAPHRTAGRTPLNVVGSVSSVARSSSGFPLPSPWFSQHGLPRHFVLPAKFVVSFKSISLSTEHLQLQPTLKSPG
jgi:hypothetical protein